MVTHDTPLPPPHAQCREHLLVPIESQQYCDIDSPFVLYLPCESQRLTFIGGQRARATTRSIELCIFLPHDTTIFPPRLVAMLLALCQHLRRSIVLPPRTGAWQKLISGTIHDAAAGFKPGVRAPGYRMSVLEYIGQHARDKERPQRRIISGR